MAEELENTEERNKFNVEMKESIRNLLLKWGWVDNSYDYIKRSHDGTEVVCESKDSLTDNKGNEIHLYNDGVSLRGKDYTYVDVPYRNVLIETCCKNKSYDQENYKKITFESPKDTSQKLAVIQEVKETKTESTSVTTFLYKITHRIETYFYFDATSKEDALEQYKEKIKEGVESRLDGFETDTVEFVNDCTFN